MKRIVENDKNKVHGWINFVQNSLFGIVFLDTGYHKQREGISVECHRLRNSYASDRGSQLICTRYCVSRLSSAGANLLVLVRNLVKEPGFVLRRSLISNIRL